jgi:hypothetical protein
MATADERNGDAGLPRLDEKNSGFLALRWAALCVGPEPGKEHVYDLRLPVCPACGAKDRVALETALSPEVLGERLAMTLTATLRALWRQLLEARSR